MAPSRSGHFIGKRQSFGRITFQVVISVVSITGLHTSRAQDLQHVIQISVDGLHSRQLEALLLDQPDRFINFQRFVDEGATTFNARTDCFSTYTLPNHTTMVTGRPVLQPADDPTVHHGYIRNGTPSTSETIHSAGNSELSYIASTFDVAHDYGLSTALYSGKTKFSIFPQSYNETTHTTGGRPDQYLANGDQGNDKIDRWVLSPGNGSSSALIDVLISDLQAQPHQYTLLHFAEPDSAGHSYGWSTSTWNDSVALVDQLLGRVFELVENDSRLKDTTAMILTADHGGLGLWHDDIQEPNIFTVPFFVWGPGVAAGVDLYELNPLTRRDPSNTQPAYTVQRQPIRNGDAGNLALGMLNLPPIDGSSINARQDLIVGLPKVATWDGTNPLAGSPGDGANWNDPRNWSRDGEVDRLFQMGDIVHLPAQNTPQTISNMASRTLRSLTVDGEYEFPEGSFQVVTGRVDLSPTARLQVAGLTSDRGLILEQGGTLEVHGPVSPFILVRGEVTGNAVVQGYADVLDRLAPGGDVGQMTIEDKLSFGSQAQLQIEVDRDELGVQHDRLTVGGRVSLRGQLAMKARPGYEDPTEAGSFDRFEFMTMPRRVGTFATITFDGTPVTFQFQTTTQRRSHVGEGLFRSIAYENDSVTWLHYRAIPGDADGNGSFDTADLVHVLQSGRYEDGDNDNADWTQGDWNGDGDFGTADIVSALAAGWYEKGSIFATAEAHPVPEPRAIMLGSIGLLVVTFFGRHRRKTSTCCKRDG